MRFLSSTDVPAFLVIEIVTVWSSRTHAELFEEVEGLFLRQLHVLIHECEEMLLFTKDGGGSDLRGLRFRVYNTYEEEIRDSTGGVEGRSPH